MVVSPNAFQKKARILVADDDRHWREGLCEALEPRGYETLEAESGEETIELVRTRGPHVLILDIHMPHLSGLETLRIIREEGREDLPAIMVSSAVSEDVLSEALALHAFTVLSKMVGVHRLLLTVARVLEKYYAL